MRFLELLKKEIKQERAWLLYGSILVCVYQIVPFIKVNMVAPYWLSLTVAPLIIITFAAQARIVGSFKREWDNHSVQLLLSLPVRGHNFVLTKFLAQAFTVCSYSLLSLLFLLLISQIKLGSTAGVTFSEILKCWLFYLLFPLPIMGFFIFSYLVGRISHYVRGLVSVLSFIAIVYGVERLVPYGRKIFEFLPKVGITIITSEGLSRMTLGGVTHQILDVSGLYFVAFFGVILLVASFFIIERAEI